MTQAHSQVAENSTRRQSTGWFEIMIGYVLLIGVLVSVSLLIVGTIWRLATTGTLQFHFHIQAMNLYDYVVSSIRSVVARELSPRIIIDLGISVLLLTPYTRVVASMLYFLTVERNWKYSLITAFVLVVLTYTLFLR